MHAAQHTRLRDVGHVDEDIVGRVAVQRSTEAFLIKVVSNETDAATEDEQTIQCTDLDVFISFLRGEGTTITEEIDEADGNASIDVEDERVLLRGGDLLDGKSVVEQAVAGEVLDDVFLHELDTEIRVVDALDLVADTADKLVGLPRVVDEFSGCKTGVASVGKHGSSLIEGTTESATDGQETGSEGGDEVLSGTRGNDGVHGTRDSGAVVGSEHENHLNELGGPRWQALDFSKVSKWVK